MPPALLYETIHRQFEVLLRNFPTEQHLAEFLAEVPIPPTTEPLRSDARQIAEMLKAAPSESLAIEELRADQDATRAFYQYAMVQFPALRESPISKSVVETNPDYPFYTLSVWILSLTDRKND